MPFRVTTAMRLRSRLSRPMSPCDVADQRIGHAPDQGEIGAVHVTGGEGGGQRGVGELGLGHDHDAGGVLVQPMDDPGPALAADPGELVAAMCQQRVDQRAVLVAGGGMHNQTCGLVEDDQVCVLIKDREMGSAAACGVAGTAGGRSSA